MSIITRLNEDLKTAMKAKDQAALRSIRAIKAAITLASTDGSGKEVDDTRVISIVQKQIKQRMDSLEIYEKQGRDDLAQIEKEEVAVIRRYLPEQMSTEDLEAFIKNLVEELGADGMKDMGRVMGVASGKLAGKADGKAIAGIVRQLLS